MGCVARIERGDLERFVPIGYVLIHRGVIISAPSEDKYSRRSADLDLGTPVLHLCDGRLDLEGAVGIIIETVF